MTELRTDYKEDILETSQQGKRTFNIVSKTGEILFEDVHIEDVTKYTQVGDEYGQEIINAQNRAINEVAKGSGLVFDTYQDYLDAREQGEVAVGNMVYIKEPLLNDNARAEDVKYNDSNVKLALDTHGAKLSNRIPYPDYPTIAEVVYSTTANTSEYTVTEDGFVIFQACSAWNVPQGFINPSATPTPVFVVQIANTSGYPVSVESAPYPVKKDDIIAVNNNGSGSGSFIRAYFIKNR